MFKVVCAWCGKHLNGSDSSVDVSHGICEECQEKAVADLPRPMAGQREEDRSDFRGERQALN